MAQGASNANEGCFLPRPDVMLHAEVPYYSSKGLPAGSIVISLNGKDSTMGCDPLQGRAWVLQESSLARRKIAFSRTQLSWEFKTLFVTETGDTIDHSFDLRPDSWEGVARHYSQLLLTFERDKLVALQGLANEFQKTRSDRYRWGVWTSDLPQHLLWHSSLSNLGRVSPKVGIPSWSWASTNGQIQFGHDKIREALRVSLRIEDMEPVAREISISDEAELGLDCPVKDACRILPQNNVTVPIQYEFAPRDQLNPFGVLIVCRIKMESSSALGPLTIVKKATTATTTNTVTEFSYAQS